MKKNIVFLILLSVVFIGSCKKDLLDLNAETYYDIKEFLKSENCDTDCNETAACEGVEVKLRALIDENNINAENNYFFIIDTNKSKYSMQVDVSEDISMQVFDKIKDIGTSVIHIEGVVKGFDAPTNTSYDRNFNVTLVDVNKLAKE